MVPRINHQSLLKSRPEGAPSLDDSGVDGSPTPETGEGELLHAHHLPFARPVHAGWRDLSPANWASMLASIIARLILQNNSKPLVQRGLTFILRVWRSGPTNRVATVQRFCAIPDAAHREDNLTTPMPGPDIFSVLRKSPPASFIASDFAVNQAEFLRDVGEWVRTGRLNIARTSSTDWKRRCSSACCRARTSARRW